MSRSFRAIFFLGGIALMVAGMNGNRPVMIVGIGMIFLALWGGKRARRGG